MMVNYLIRETKPVDIDATIDLRGRTRENPVSRKRLNDLGINYASISASLSSGECKGFVCEHEGSIIGFCTGNSKTGEVLVLAVAPEHEKKGIGARLLNRVVNWLNAKGHTKVWLAADPDPKLRAFGFYRSQGWQSTGELDVHGDERELLSNLVFGHLIQAASWSMSVTSIPSLNLTPVITLAR